MSTPAGVVVHWEDSRAQASDSGFGFGPEVLLWQLLLDIPEVSARLPPGQLRKLFQVHPKKGWSRVYGDSKKNLRRLADGNDVLIAVYDTDKRNDVGKQLGLGPNAPRDRGRAALAKGRCPTGVWDCDRFCPSMSSAEALAQSLPPSGSSRAHA
jgi:hypothetical protein